MKPNLVLIVGDTATRYVNGKREQVVKIDFTVGIRQIREDIEFFRVNGVPLLEE